MNKACCRCKIIKPIQDFNKSKPGLFGVHSICKACKAVYMKEYRSSGKLKISKDKYRKTEKGQNTIKAYTKSTNNKLIQKAYRESTLGRPVCTAKLAKYRALKKLAMPIWVNKQELKNLYKNCSKGLEVDHIIPLQNDLVSGLHVPWNLQYLTSDENKRKSNQFDGTRNNTTWLVKL